ncbi:MAG: hypothetical protein GY853_05880 [PVC group bacterium]|nr:hypothetical protein [PVC group bacterium]
MKELTNTEELEIIKESLMFDSEYGELDIDEIINSQKAINQINLYLEKTHGTLV